MRACASGDAAWRCLHHTDDFAAPSSLKNDCATSSRPTPAAVAKSSGARRLARYSAASGPVRQARVHERSPAGRRGVIERRFPIDQEPDQRLLDTGDLW